MFITQRSLCRINSDSPPGTMSKMYPSVSNMCCHGCGSEGTLMHMLLNCPAVKQFWQDIVNDVTPVLDTEIALCPIVCLLGKSRHTKRTILINWKKRKKKTSV